MVLYLINNFMLCEVKEGYHVFNFFTVERDGFAKMRKVWKNCFYLCHILWKTSKTSFLWRILYAILSALIAPMSILLTQYLIESIENIELVGFYNIVVVIIAYIAPTLAIQIFSSILSYWINPLINMKFTRELNNLVLSKSVGLDFVCFDDSEFYDKYTRAISEADNRAIKLFDQLMTWFSNFLSLVSLGSMLAIYDPIIIIFSIANIVTAFLFGLFINKDNYNCSQESTRFKRILSYAKRILYQPQYAKDLRLEKNLGSIFLKRYNDAMSDIMDTTKKYGKKMMLKNIIQTIIQVGFDALIMIYLSWKVVRLDYTLGKFVALMNTSQQLGVSLSRFLNSFSGFHNSSLYIENLLTILNYEPVMEEREGQKIGEESLSISVKNLNFKYKNSQSYVLKNINLNVTKGQHIAIVGLNGAGKSTLVKLLCGLYEIPMGEIRYNNINIMELSTQTIRDNISTVFQDYNVYGLSVAENISRGQALDSNELIKCLKKANFYDRCLKMENKENTILSTEFAGGIALSGGESQKIALAAAFYKKAKLLIFDEPSSNLDPKAEHELFDLIDQYYKDTTTILISHKLANVKQCDVIYYMENGEILEVGSHASLMSLEGKYADLYNIQASEY